jgi:hypothetical protein
LSVAAPVIPPKDQPSESAVTDFVFPADLISLSSGRGGGWSYDPFFEFLKSGDTVLLYLPMQRGGATKEFSFRFGVRVKVATGNRVTGNPVPIPPLTGSAQAPEPSPAVTICCQCHEPIPEGEAVSVGCGLAHWVCPRDRKKPTP